jgi:hypothetical protein
MKVNIESEWQKTHNDECFILLETLSVKNKVDRSENYDEKTGDIIMVNLISDDEKLIVMFEGNLNNKNLKNVFGKFLSKRMKPPKVFFATAVNIGVDR